MGNNPVLKTASVGVLLIALWLIVYGICQGLSAYFYIQGVAGVLSCKITPMTSMLLCFVRTLPLVLGVVLWNSQTYAVRLLFRDVSPENSDRINWNESRYSASLALGLLGLFILSKGLLDFLDDPFVTTWILSIDMPGKNSFPESRPFPLFFPIVFGAVLFFGANPIGRLMGDRIDKQIGKEFDEEPVEENIKENADENERGDSKKA